MKPRRKSKYLQAVQAHTLEQNRGAGPKQQCIQLHQQGASYHEIATQLGLATATVRTWILEKDTDIPRG